MATLHRSAKDSVARGDGAEHASTDGNRRQFAAGARKRRPPQSRPHEPAPQALQTAIECWTAKADWNEKVARRATRAIIWSSAAIPITIVASTEGQEFLLGRLAPSVLGGVAACAAGWLQFARPYEGWKLFRHYQRWGETERFRYELGLKPYNFEDAKENGRQLGERMIEHLSALEPEWEHLLPPDAGVANQAPHK
jgi:hypothetical protein